MEEKLTTPEKLPGDKKEKTARRSKSAQKQTVENEPETLQTPSSQESSDLRRSTRRSARLNWSESPVKQKDCPEDKKKEESVIKSPSKRKGKVVDVGEEVGHDSPRSKRTKSQLSKILETEDVLNKSSERKSRKQKEHLDEDQCGENLGKIPNLNNSQSASEDVGKRKFGQARKKQDESVCDQANVENCDSLSASKKHKKTRKSRNKESDEAELQELDIQENCENSATNDSISPDNKPRKKTRKSKNNESEEAELQELATQENCEDNVTSDLTSPDNKQKKKTRKSKTDESEEGEFQESGIQGNCENNVTGDSVSPDNKPRKKTRKSKNNESEEAELQEPATQEKCENSVTSNSVSPDSKPRKKTRKSKNNESEEAELQELATQEKCENSVTSDSVSPDSKPRKKNRKSKNNESEEAESQELATQENSVVVSETRIMTPKETSSKDDKGKSGSNIKDSSSPDISEKLSERTDKTKKSSSGKFSSENRSTVSPPKDLTVGVEDVSDNDVTFLSKKIRPQCEVLPKMMTYDEVQLEDSGESKDDIEITHIKSPTTKFTIKSVDKKEVDNSSDFEITFFGSKLDKRPPKERVREDEVSESEVKYLAEVPKRKEKREDALSLDVAMEVEVKDDESSSGITFLSEQLKIKKKSIQEDTGEMGDKSEDLQNVSTASKKSQHREKIDADPSKVKEKELFSMSQNEKNESHELHSYAKTLRFNKEGTSSKSTGVGRGQEYNRSISEEISLLKPKTFAARRSEVVLKKVLNDQYEGSAAEDDSDAECRKAIMESAQRRIELNLSTSESDSRLFRGLHTAKPRISKDDDVSSDSGSAPEVVSFESARKITADSIKNVNEHIKKERQRLKEKRKARLELLKQQKEQKLIRLKEKMASQEDASCSSSEESGYEEELRNARLKMKKKKKVKAAEEPTEKENVDEPVAGSAGLPKADAPSDDTSEQEFIGSKEAMSLNSLKRMQMDLHKAPEESVPSKVAKVSVNNGSIHDEKMKKKKPKDDKKTGFNSLTSLDYIPLNVEGATKFMVVPLEKTAHLSLADEARKFREESLYHWNKREAATESKVVRRKKRTAMKNAVQTRYM